MLRFDLLGDISTGIVRISLKWVKIVVKISKILMSNSFKILINKDFYCNYNIFIILKIWEP